MLHSGDMIAREEKENLNRSFKTYELFYFTLITIVYSISIVMILPFIKIYTSGVTDANYYRPIFAIFLIIAEFIWSIRQPYNDLVKVAGHFKETRKGAWIEAFTNLLLSIILVLKFGIIGVAIGILVSMLIRTAEFMYHTSKYILQRNQKENIKRIFIIVIEILLIVPIGFYISNYILVNSYTMWILLGIIIGIVSFIIVGVINGIIYKKDLKDLVGMIKRVFMKRKKC